MMTEKDREIAQQLKRKLSEVVSLVDFKVYGLRARGTDEDSDMEVFIEVETLERDIEKKIRNK